MESSNKNETSIIEILLQRIEQSKEVVRNGNVTVGSVKRFCRLSNRQLSKIYGAENEISNSWLPQHISEHIDPTKELKKRIHLLEHYLEAIQNSRYETFVKCNNASRVFIGHGQSPIWRELKDFLHDRLSLRWDEFNREAVAGIATFERISEMLNYANFAFLIMTAEDQHSDDTIHARQNVVHEVGLFQGKLGPRKAIILLEDGCNEFSNIIGLSQIRFPKGNIASIFEQIRRVLEREDIISI